MPLFTEKSLVEDYFVQKLQEKGWKYTPADDLERESLEEPLLTATLIRALNRTNADIGIGDEEVKQALNELKLKGRGSEDAKRILHYYKLGISIKFEKERVVKYIRLFDYENIQNNEFTISRQVIHQSGDRQIRNDIILYINGIPIANIECKNPTSLTENWHNAYTQIKDYEKTIPELYKYAQIGIAAETTAKYFPIVPWQQEDIKIHEWREKSRDSIDSTIEMLTPNTLLNIIKSYLFFRIEYGSATKVVTRYMQYRAAEQITNRIIHHIQGKTPKNKGLIWHWQGSGKTLTMIFAANKLYHAKELENPTIFFIVDREELQEQLRQEFTALDITKPEIINTINTLKKALKHDQGKGKRGILITLIQKFRPEQFAILQAALEKLSKDRETILTRKNVIAFVDEGHRTQYGTLAGQMREILPNAAFFAFTGTPISIRHRDTYREFSYPPEENYLDKYFITDSIQDGFTVKIAYQPRLEKLHLKKSMLEFFLKSEYEEVPEQYRRGVEKDVRRKLNRINVYFENENRINLKAKDIAKHFRENFEGKFKAMVVAASRLACVRYKRALDRILPKEYSEVVMTFGKPYLGENQDYLRELTKRYKGKDIEDIRKEIVEKFKEEGEYPKILIVTDMLLTGFDAPILQTMYLDKPLREHSLLQAIARTNRPHKVVKEAGLILDYAGILTNFIKAFENYSKEDIKGAVFKTEDLRKDFIQTLNETLSFFENIPKDQYEREIMLRAIEAVTTDERISKKFAENYKRLRKLFELLGPHEVKIRKFHEYKWLSKVYVCYMKEVMGDRVTEKKYVQKYFRKTLEYVYRTTELENIEKELPTIQFDENYLKSLEEKAKTKEEKAANIVFTLNRFILVDKEKSPVYESLAEKVERILKLWKQRTKDYGQIYKEGQQIFEEINKLQDRQKQLGYTDLEYSMLLTLENKFGTNKSLTQDVKTLTDQMRPLMFRGWYTQPTARKNIERKVRKHIRKYIKKHGINLKELEELHQKIMENVKNYGQKI